MRVISLQELCGNSTAVLDAVRAGETFHIARNGVAIAELRPLPRRRRLTAEELVERHRRLPRIVPDVPRQDVDEPSGPENGGGDGG